MLAVSLCLSLCVRQNDRTGQSAMQTECVHDTFMCFSTSVAAKKKCFDAIDLFATFVSLVFFIFRSVLVCFLSRTAAIVHFARNRARLRSPRFLLCSVNLSLCRSLDFGFNASCRWVCVCSAPPRQAAFLWATAKLYRCGEWHFELNISFWKLAKSNARKTNDIKNKKNRRKFRQRQQRRRWQQWQQQQQRFRSRHSGGGDGVGGGTVKRKRYWNSCIHSFFMHYVMSKSDYTKNEKKKANGTRFNDTKVANRH